MLHSFFAQFPKSNVKAQYEANIKQLTGMKNKAVKTGKLVSGFTADQLEVMISKMSANSATL